MLTGIRSFISLALFLVLTIATNSHAQVVLSEDFGSGSNPGSPLPSGITTYTYNGSASGAWPDVVNDGQYTIGTNTQLASNSWSDISDHTSNNGTGYMMIVNATEGLSDEFFRDTVALSANTKYEFAAFLINANSQGDYDYCTNNQGGLILPNVKISIETVGGTELATTSSGEIGFNPTPIWGEYKLNFTTSPSTASVQLVLTNLAHGGCGNDLALDDISFRVAVTMEASNDNATVADATSGATNVINVLSNDQMDGNAISTFVLSLAAGTTLPSALTFNTATGQVGVVSGASTGIYTFSYKVCETVLAYNCDTATVSIDVTTPIIPVLNVLKTNTIFDPNTEGLYAIPGNDIIYIITVENSGNGTVDTDSMFLADALPTEVSFYNGDMDDSGSLTSDPVAWSQTGTSMSLNYNTNVGFSNGFTPPNSLLDCTYTPTSGYDPNVNFVCFNPQGGMPASNGSDPEWSVSFRVKIN